MSSELLTTTSPNGSNNDNNNMDQLDDDDILWENGDDVDGEHLSFEHRIRRDTTRAKLFDLLPKMFADDVVKEKPFIRNRMLEPHGWIPINFLMREQEIYTTTNDIDLIIEAFMRHDDIFEVNEVEGKVRRRTVLFADFLPHMIKCSILVFDRDPSASLTISMDERIKRFINITGLFKAPFKNCFFRYVYPSCKPKRDVMRLFTEYPSLKSQCFVMYQFSSEADMQRAINFVSLINEAQESKVMETLEKITKSYKTGDVTLESFQQMTARYVFMKLSDFTDPQSGNWRSGNGCEQILVNFPRKRNTHSQSMYDSNNKNFFYNNGQNCSKSGVQSSGRRQRNTNSVSNSITVPTRNHNINSNSQSANSGIDSASFLSLSFGRSRHDSENQGGAVVTVPPLVSHLGIKLNQQLVIGPKTTLTRAPKGPSDAMCDNFSIFKS